MEFIQQVMAMIESAINTGLNKTSLSLTSGSLKCMEAIYNELNKMGFYIKFDSNKRQEVTITWR